MMFNNFKLPKDHTFIYLDVVNLFGNLMKDVVEIINIKWGTIREHSEINQRLLLEIIQFILDDDYRVFRGRKLMDVQ